MTQISLENDWSSILARVGSAEDLDTSARASGALIRRRGVKSGAALLRLALAYSSGYSLRSVSAWAGMADVAQLSDVAVLLRLRNAADWLGQLAGSLVAPPQPLGASGGRFLRIVDGTMIKAPGRTNEEWRLHAAYDLDHHRFSALELTDRHGAERLERAPVVAGEIRVADRCYARPDGLAQVLAAGADFLVRIGWKSLRLTDAQGEPLDLPVLLGSLPPGEKADIAVRIVHPRKRQVQPIAGRLIILPKAPKAIERSCAKAKKASSRGGHRLDERTLLAARFTMLVTSLPADEYTPDQVGATYRLRWQIELAFKRLKSIVDFDMLRAKDRNLARAWIYAKLILALLTDEIRREIPDSPP